MPFIQNLKNNINLVYYKEKPSQPSGNLKIVTSSDAMLSDRGRFEKLDAAREANRKENAAMTQAAKDFAAKHKWGDSSNS